MTSKDCFFCGEKPKQIIEIDGPDHTKKQKLHSRYIYNGVDRLDNTKGYTYDNCVSCCGTCNKTKGTMHIDDFLNWVKQVYEHKYKKDG